MEANNTRRGKEVFTVVRHEAFAGDSLVGVYSDRLSAEDRVESEIHLRDTSDEPKAPDLTFTVEVHEL